MGRVRWFVKCAVVFAVATGSVGLHGCAFLGMQTESSGYDPERANRPPRCTEHKILALVDASGALSGAVGVGLGAYITALTANIGGSVTGIGIATIGYGVGALLGHGLSAMYGFNQAQRCAELNNRYDESQRLE